MSEAFVYLSVFDLVLEGLLEKAKGVLLVVSLHPDIPGLLHLNLHSSKKESVTKETIGYLQYNLHPFSHLHILVTLDHGFVLPLHLYHLLSHPLHLTVQLSIDPQQVLIVHQQAAHLKPAQEDGHQTELTEGREATEPLAENPFHITARQYKWTEVGGGISPF